MARTETARQLTELHRLGQLQIRARALRDYSQLWPMWEGDEDSFLTLIASAIVLVRTYRGLSSAYAGRYFQSYRMAEGVSGEAVTRLAGPVDEGKVKAGLVVTGRKAVGDTITAGRPGEAAKETALSRTSGSISRHVLNGGRETILRSVAEDKEALGWGRVTDGDPCAFCAMLAGRGPVYEEDTVGFEAHDECGCGAEPVYFRDAPWPGRASEFHDMYNEAILEAREADELDPSQKNYLLNAFRRRYEAQRRQIVVAQ